MDTIFVQAGKCSLGFMCLPQGAIMTSFSACTRTAETEIYSLDETERRFNSTLHGMITISMVNITEAKRTFKWQSYIPISNQVPNFRNGWEYFSIFLIILILAMLSYNIFYFAMKYNRSGNKTYIVSSAIQIYWILTVIYHVVVYLVPRDDDGNGKLQAQTTTSGAAIFPFATFLSTMHTTSMLVGAAGLAAWKNNTAYGIIIFLHILLCTPNYLYWLMYQPPSIEFFNFLRFWSYFYGYWLVFAVIFNMSPFMFLIYKVVIRTNANNKDMEAGIIIS